MRNLRNSLLDALRERQMSPEDLADLTGIDASIVRRLAHPASNPFLDHALRVARALDCPVADLFSLEPDSSPT